MAEAHRSLEAGGANAVLAAYQVIIVGGLLALWKNGVLSGLSGNDLAHAGMAFGHATRLGDRGASAGRS